MPEPAGRRKVSCTRSARYDVEPAAGCRDLPGGRVPRAIATWSFTTAGRGPKMDSSMCRASAAGTAVVVHAIARTAVRARAQVVVEHEIQHQRVAAVGAPEIQAG